MLWAGKSISLSLGIISTDLNSVEWLCWTSPKDICLHHLIHPKSNTQNTIQCSDPSTQSKDSVSRNMSVKTSAVRMRHTVEPDLVEDTVRCINEGLRTGHIQTTGKRSRSHAGFKERNLGLHPLDSSPGPPLERLWPRWISIHRSTAHCPKVFPLSHSRLLGSHWSLLR